MKSQYFDVNEFDDDPIKYSYKAFYGQVGYNSSDFKVFKISQNYAIL